VFFNVVQHQPIVASANPNGLILFIQQHAFNKEIILFACHVGKRSIFVLHQTKAGAYPQILFLVGNQYPGMKGLKGRCIVFSVHIKLCTIKPDQSVKTANPEVIVRILQQVNKGIGRQSIIGRPVRNFILINFVDASALRLSMNTTCKPLHKKGNKKKTQWFGAHKTRFKNKLAQNTSSNNEDVNNTVEKLLTTFN
jgi:hypothetical protein